MLSWVNRFNICSFLDNHQYHSSYSAVECIAACGSIDSLPANATLDHIDSFIQQHKGRWIFGHISYDSKNQVETLNSSHPDSIQFPDLFFFVPAIVVKLSEDALDITCNDNSDAATVFQEIQSAQPIQPAEVPPLNIQSRFSRDEYIGVIQQLKQHIRRGDCYEINFCQEFYALGVQVNPVSLYQQLTALSPNPFSCYYRHKDQYLLCASPERFLQKKGDTLLSQPIKGTIHRNLEDADEDMRMIQQLRTSEKDKSENVMVVDLVRNDLSKVCEEGTVKVSELFGIYSFPQVHQMISTVEGKLPETILFSSILKACFPMGSMTGAPKKRVMELIEQYEKTKRGLYSGAVGYIDPDGDFDFNVVIRSILYNATNQYLGYQVGGGITFYSDPEKEYEECLLKAAAIRKVLQSE